MTDPTPRSTGNLLADALRHLSDLLRGEVALARAEITQNIRGATAGIGLLVAAALLAMTALNFLGAALVDGLIRLGLAPGWAALSVAAVAGLVAVILAWKGARALNPDSLFPDRTLRRVRRDVETLKETFTHDPSP